jgi:hypothetical protein
MIDEGDDCAYVIGNNALHSGQFSLIQNFLKCLRNFVLNFHFFFLVPTVHFSEQGC